MIKHEVHRKLLAGQRRRSYIGSMQFIALGNLHGGPQFFTNLIGKGLSAVATVDQHATYLIKIGRTAPHGFKRARPIRNLCGRDSHRVRKSLCINGNMPLDPRNLLARVVALVPCARRVLHTLRINDQEARLCVAIQFGTGRANLIF